MHNDSIYHRMPSANASFARDTFALAANGSFSINDHIRLRKGVWGEPTATVDWCEINYQYSPYIAEFWNTVSNLLFVVLGIYGLVRSIREGFEWRFRILFLATAVIGFGSAMFHGTLQMVHQQFDETPMIWGMLVWIYIVYNKEIRQLGVPEAFVITGFAAFGIGFAILHAIYNFVVAFQVLFGVLVFLCFVRIVAHYTTVRDPRARAVGKSSMYAVLLGVALWMMDYHYCEQITSLPVNPQGHAWWHIFMGMCTYNSPLFMQYVRAEELRKKAEIVDTPFGLQTIVIHDTTEHKQKTL